MSPPVKTQERPPVIEGIHFYREPGGRLVFTELYHLQRGWCCQGRCRHCPWKEVQKTPESEKT